MNAGELCTRNVIIARAEESVLEAARLMVRFDVGNVVVVQEDDEKRRPVGLLTDRDIVLRVVAAGESPEKVLVREIMSKDVATIDEHAGLDETIRLMKAHRVRRLPVVNERGSLEGILALDDIVDLLAEELQNIASLIERQQELQDALRPMPGR